MLNFHVLAARGLPRLVLVCVFACMLAACGESHRDDAPQPSAQSSSLHGQAIKGVMANAIVRLLHADSRAVLAATRTDTFGRFSFSEFSSSASAANTHLSAYLVELTTDSNSRMRCDYPAGCTDAAGTHRAFGEWISLPANFKLLAAWHPDAPGRVQLSPLSHVVAETALALPGGLTAANVATARDWLQEALTLSLADGQNWPDITQLHEQGNFSLGTLTHAVYAAAFMHPSLRDFWRQPTTLDTLPIGLIHAEVASIAQELQSRYTRNADTQAMAHAGATLETILTSASTLADAINTQPLRITRQPASQEVHEGDPSVLHINATSMYAPLRFQWYRDGEVIAGANAPTLGIDFTTPADAGVYTVSVSDAQTQMMSDGALLLVAPPRELRILTPPQPQTLTSGQSLHLSVTASGSGPLQYQWQKNGSILPAEHGPTLHIPHVEVSDAGSYRVHVSNASQTLTSPFIDVVVTPGLAPVHIDEHPQDQALIAGATAWFQVTASGDGFLQYQWYFNNIAIAGAHDAQLTIANVQHHNAGQYSVRVSNSQGEVRSLPASLQVTDPAGLVIVHQPQGLALNEGQSSRLSVTAVSGSNADVHYEWVKDGTALPGASQATLVLDAVTAADAGNYQVRVFDGRQSLLSAEARVTVSVMRSLALSWQIPTLREDGSNLAAADIAGYRLVYGSGDAASDNIVDIEGAENTHYTLTDLPAGNLVLRIATIAADGRAGAFSAPITINL